MADVNDQPPARSIAEEVAAAIGTGTPLDDGKAILSRVGARLIPLAALGGAGSAAVATVLAIRGDMSESDLTIAIGVGLALGFAVGRLTLLASTRIGAFGRFAIARGPRLAGTAISLPGYLSAGLAAGAIVRWTQTGNPGTVGQMLGTAAFLALVSPVFVGIAAAFAASPRPDDPVQASAGDGAFTTPPRTLLGGAPVFWKVGFTVFWFVGAFRAVIAGLGVLEQIDRERYLSAALFIAPAALVAWIVLWVLGSILFARWLDSRSARWRGAPSGDPPHE